MSVVNNNSKLMNVQLQNSNKCAKEFFQSDAFKKVLGMALIVIGALGVMAIVPLALFVASKMPRAEGIGMAVGVGASAALLCVLGKTLVESTEPVMMGWGGGRD